MRLWPKKTRLRFLSLCSATSSQLHFFKFIFFFNVYHFTDINECKGNHSCHVNATCMNTKGSYVCTCHPGYTGNGSDCTGIWCISIETISTRIKTHYHICETCFTSIPCIDPFTPKVSLIILLTVCHTILMMSVLRIWYWINW